MINLQRLDTGGFAITLNIPSDVAGCLIKNVGFARDEAFRLYYYDEGVYKVGGVNIIDYLYKMLVEQQGQARQWNDKMAKKVHDYIIADAKPLIERPMMDRINFRNGLYFIESQRFELHSEVDHRDYRTSTQLPIDYNPKAKGEYWKRFLGEIFPEDPNLLIDIIGLCMVPFTGLQKCIVLIGGGSNGKGTFLAALQQIVGKANYSNLELKRLTGNDSRFNTSVLQNKLVNIVGDVSPTDIENTGVFKKLTGEDDITIEYKGKQPFSYKPFARLIFSCNEVLESDDKTVGFKRRFFCIPFDKTFPVDPKKKLEIEEMLLDPEELGGMLNLALPRLSDLIENGLKYNEAAAAKVDNYVPIPKWFKIWFEKYIVVDFDAKTPSEVIYGCYASTITEFKPDDVWVERASMINYLKASVPGLIVGKVMRYGDKIVRGYIGIKVNPLANLPTVITPNEAIVDEGEEIIN
jgi:putative DNA primase/helicase